MSDPTCSSGGWIVGMEEPIPTQLSEYYPVGGTFCGCNRLQCRTCGAWVRHFDKVHCAAITLGRDECMKLYESTYPLAFELSSRDDQARIYVCHCSFEQTRGGRSMDSLDNSNWYCAGHPQP